ncbi:MAG: sigma-70 family RNA polymerase sigma factor [Oscillospiraceae bacterium]|nr:sigma-70 family RNA polymerase sigma factor [Oscillospiraceae bacterium]
MTDEELCAKLDQVREGDMTAFEEIYCELKTPVMTVAMRITGDRHAAEDVLQEVFVKLYQSPPDPRIKKPRAYIFRMARNLAIDGIRVQQPVSLDGYEDTLQSKDPDPAGRLDIEAALMSLPSEQRQTVSLHLNGGLKFREIADITETPLGTVLWRYRKAIKRLQDLLEVK